MASGVPLNRVLDLCDPRSSWPWCCRAPDEEALRHLLQSAELQPEPVSHAGTAEMHVGRVRYLAQHGWDDPIEVDVGIPSLGYSGPSWPVVDGNHRLWAAALREDEFILVEVTGQVNHAARLLGVPECIIA